MQFIGVYFQIECTCIKMAKNELLTSINALLCLGWGMIEVSDLGIYFGFVCLK